MVEEHAKEPTISASWERAKYFFTFQLPTFTKWVLLQPVIQVLNIDTRGLLVPLAVLAMYGGWTNNRAITLSSAGAFFAIFLKGEYDRGEWMHWHREKYKQKAIDEAKEVK